MKLWTNRRDSRAAQAQERAGKEAIKEPANLTGEEKDFIHACVEYYRKLVKDCGYTKREAFTKTVRLMVRLLINIY